MAWSFPSLPAIARGRRPRPLQAIRRRLHERGERGSALAFGLRLVVTVAFAFGLIGVSGYLLLERHLADKQVSDLASAQRADVRSFESYGAHARSAAQALRDIDIVLDAVGQRPGTLEAMLIDPRGVVVEASDDATVGSLQSDGPIRAALGSGRFYAGHENDPRRDRRDFEFVAPVQLPSGRYAFEVTYDHRAYDAQLRDVRAALALVGLLSLLGGGLVFYLVGGRRLMREHRMVLRRATRDGLTDLPNQRAFGDELPRAVAAAERYGDSLALALLDIDEFKQINDRRGHPEGDAVLRRTADVLHGSRPGDRPYRIGGDEFALLLAHTDAEGARTLARRLGRRLADAGVHASMGVSVLRPGLSADTLRAEADSALYEAKRQGGDRAAHFADVQGRVVVTTAEKKQAVRRLIEEGQVSTVFQPIWNFATHELLGVEALTRLDPGYGLSGPAEAFDIAEQLGRVQQLDQLCLRNALRSAPQLSEGVLLFVNVAPLTLDLDAERCDWLGEAVDEAGLARDQVVIEVTERFGGRTASVVRCLQRLREQGFRVAVDDVGTGNSGLEMLSRLRAEFVKIDRSVVAGAATEPGARAVLMAMATFARQTGAFVIAEGIEDDETLAFLRALDERELSTEAIIQGGQGHRLGRPSPQLSPHTPPGLPPRAGPADGPRRRDGQAQLSGGASAVRRRA